MITKNQLIDYASTLLFFGVATLTTYQAQLMATIPKEYALLFLIVFGILNQVTADARVKGVLTRGNETINAYQVELDKALEQIKYLEAQLDIKQNEIIDEGA